MKLVTYEINGTEQTGILNSDETWVYPSASFIRPYADMNVRYPAHSQESRSACWRRSPALLRMLSVLASTIWRMQRKLPVTGMMLSAVNGLIRSISPKE